MTRFWIGTSGWNYKHWKEVFYPKELPARRWFRFYAGHFPTVEINYSHYREPSEKSWDAWREEAPGGFRFAVKAHRYLTHLRRLKEPEEPLARVIKGARRLGDRLGPILYQFPPNFQRTEEMAARLHSFLRMLPGDLMHAFEFRHDSWYGEETLGRLRRHGAAFCCFQRGSQESPLAVTAGFAYMRFHGSEARYHGNYTDQMLREWAGRLRRLSSDAREMFVYFNNDPEGFAVANALKLADLLGVRRSAGAGA
jgi:uncharacterized protein YecE (DUF72 family)